MEGDRYGGVCCLLEVPEGCSCQVNVLQCTLEGIEIVVGKYIRWKYVPLGYCSGKEAVFVVVVGGGYLCGWLDLVWLCPGLRYWLGLMSKRLFVILYMVESLASALLCSRVGQDRAEAKADPDEPETLLPGAGPPLGSWCFGWYMAPTRGSSIRGVGGPDSNRHSS